MFSILEHSLEIQILQGKKCPPSRTAPPPLLTNELIISIIYQNKTGVEMLVL